MQVLYKRATVGIMEGSLGNNSIQVYCRDSLVGDVLDLPCLDYFLLWCISAYFSLSTTG